MGRPSPGVGREVRGVARTRVMYTILLIPFYSYNSTPTHMSFIHTTTFGTYIVFINNRRQGTYFSRASAQRALDECLSELVLPCNT